MIGKFIQPLTEDIILPSSDAMPPGLVGVASGYLGRYREFEAAMQDLWIPDRAEKRYFIGVGICHNFNEMVRYVLRNNHMEWLFIMGDDHVFKPNLLWQLYQRDVDVVVPLCLHRDSFEPVLNRGEVGGFRKIPTSWEILRGKSGLMEWDGTCGNAGMLIRRNVFEKMEEPWFRAGQINIEYDSSDVYFSHSLITAGFKIHVDLDNPIGHINHTAIWPKKEEDGSWSVEFYNA